MVTFAMVKPLGGILKRLDVKALAEKIKAVDAEMVFNIPDEADEEAKARRAAEIGLLGEIIIVELSLRLEDVADDLVKLCAAYKECTPEEMMRQNPLDVLKELFSEDGFGDFFKSAVQSATQKP